jgi:hypothetical protein
MSREWTWGAWIRHANQGWPEGVEPDEVVEAETVDGTMVKVAVKVPWHTDQNAVTRFRRREYTHIVSGHTFIEEDDDQ